MNSFAKKPGKVQPPVSATASLPSQATTEPHDGVASILRLQRIIGNQSIQRLLNSQEPSHKQCTPLVFGGSAARMLAPLDARGGGSGEEVVDQRQVHRAPPDGGTAADAGAPARPTPINVRNGPAHAAIDSGDSVGMSIAITISSSSGTDADMAGIEDSEQVGLSFNHTGSMVGVTPLPSSQSGFMPGHPIPDDQHAWSKAAVIDRADNHGGNGSFEKQQLDIFKDTAAGITSPRVIPKSGYIIKRQITKSGTSITLRTEKRAAAATVNGFTTEAGPSATQANDVVVRA